MLRKFLKAGPKKHAVKKRLDPSASAQLRGLADAGRARVLKGFFKTGAREYGQGDVFLGVTVPQARVLAGRFRELPYGALGRLMRSPIHEERLLALLILVERFEKSSGGPRRQALNFYKKNLRFVNNWDLVDLTAHRILGPQLETTSFFLKKLLRSKNLWARRIGIVSTWYLIRRGRLGPTLEAAKTLLRDSEDLIHKAAGWMLREVGKKDRHALECFLKKNCRKMPRVMLRYAIEKFPAGKRRMYLRARS